MRKRRPQVIEDNQETDRWLISYADFITLLFAFFVVMYSVSQVNESKYKILSDSLVKAFDTPRRSDHPIQIGQVSRALQPITGDDREQPELDSENEEKGSMDSQNFASSEEFKELEQGLKDSLGDLIEQDFAEIKSDANWININLRSGLLFPSGSDNLNDGSDVLMEEVARHLNTNLQLILVHGHTDNIPIATERFPSNWELSAARGVAVVRKLQDKGVAPNRMSVEGHGEFQPIAPNNTADGRTRNRRVVISISRKRKVPKAEIETPLKATTLQAEGNTKPTVDEAKATEKEKEPEFEIVRLPGGGILIRGKESPPAEEGSSKDGQQ